jgi:hypothetical protein
MATVAVARSECSCLDGHRYGETAGSAMSVKKLPGLAGVLSASIVEWPGEAHLRLAGKLILHE